MIKISLEIPDEFQSCVETYLNSQVVASAHPVTGAIVMQRVYDTAEDWAEAIFRDKVAEVARMYPSLAMQTKIDQQKQLQQEIIDMSKPPSLKSVEAAPVVAEEMVALPKGSKL